MTQTSGIGGPPLLQTLLGQPDRVGAAKGQAAASNGASVTGINDKTQLSGAGSVLAGANGDDVRSAKVDQIKAAIANGSYNVSAGAVADKLIQSMQR